MKNLFFTTVFSLLAAFTFAQQAQSKSTTLKDEIVEASCGTCNFGLEGKKCELAIKFKGTSYFVDGTTIKDHGDPHAKDGFCNSVRKAKVSGSLVNGRFKATSLKLLKPEKAERGTSQ